MACGSKKRARSGRQKGRGRSGCGGGWGRADVREGLALSAVWEEDLWRG